jgi:hypothetical protein
MKQGRNMMGLALALVVLCAPMLASAAAAPKSSAAPPATAAKNKSGSRQFTGYVTALDRSSLTVEKRGQKPHSMTFSRDEATTTSGEIGKETRVTVYYRDEGGHNVAQRVVAKTAAAKPSKTAAAGER